MASCKLIINFAAYYKKVDAIIEVDSISKEYRLGLVGSSSINDDIKRYWAKIRGKEDPALKLGNNNILSIKQGMQSLEYIWALKDVSFKVRQGEVLGIIGKNGAGKSTLLKILSKVTSPTSGNIKIKGRIASLLEVGTGFHHDLTGRENIFLNGAILGMTKSEIKSKFDEIVDFSGVERYIDTPVKRYSSGMYVRLAFSVAAHLEPEILIVDEVLAVGDAEFQKKCLGKMGTVAKGGRTILFVSHNLSAMNSLCKNGIYLKNGEIKYSGLIKNTVTNYLSEESNLKSKVSWTENERPGDEIASLISARIIDEKHNDIFYIDIHHKIGIEFKYKVLKEGEFRLPNIHIYNVKGECAFLSVEKEDKKLKNKGIFKAIMWIPANLLNADVYIVGIALSTLSPTVKVHFFEENALMFDAIEDINERTNEYVQSIPGIIRPLLDWETEIIQ